jgi:hypothetical protein
MAHSGEWTPRRARGVGEAASADEVILLDAHATPVLRLNQTARAIWELCDGATNLDEIVDACVSLFDVGEDQARRDVTTTLEQLERAGVLE